MSANPFRKDTIGKTREETPGWRAISKNREQTLPGVLCWKGEMVFVSANIPEDQSYSWIEVDQSRCNRCGTCIDMCPMDVLHFSRVGLPYMKYRDDFHVGFCLPPKPVE
jgi:ferredoxin